jgi:GNAT superfamily N-acetyltransferase
MKITHRSFVFIESSFRGMGIGKQILEKAKDMAKAEHADLITLHTLNPNLNKFYEKQGARIVCDGNIGVNPTTFLRINIS